MLVDYLNVSIHGYACELFVNGAPILTTPADVPYTATPTISEWLLEGDNEIVVRVDAIVPASAPVDPLSPRRLIVQRCEGPLDEIVPAGEDLVFDQLVHQPQPGDPAPELPLRLVHRFQAQPGRTWAWASAAPLGLDTSTIRELRLFLESIHADLLCGDIDDLVDRQRVKLAELAPRYGSDPASARDGLKQQFAELSADGAWTVEPLRLEDIELRSCCGGRLVEPRTRDGQPLFRGMAADETAWSLPVFIARIDGLFEIVR